MSNNLGNKETMAKNIQFYMDLHSKTRNELCEALNVPYTTLTDWLKGKTYPRIDKIELMANYFGISKADLVEERKPIPKQDELSPEHKEMIEIIKTADTDELRRISEILKLVRGAKE